MGMSSGTGTISETDFVLFEESTYYRLLNSIKRVDGRKHSPEVLHKYLAGGKDTIYLFFDKQGLERILSENEGNFFVQALKEKRLPDSTREFFKYPYEVYDFEHFYSFELPIKNNYFFKLYPKPEQVREGILEGRFSERWKVDEELLEVKSRLKLERISSNVLFGAVLFILSSYDSTPGLSGLSSTLASTLMGVAVYDLVIRGKFYDDANKILAKKSKAYLPSDGYLHYPVKKAKEVYLNVAEGLQEIYNRAI